MASHVLWNIPLPPFIRGRQNFCVNKYIVPQDFNKKSLCKVLPTRDARTVMHSGQADPARTLDVFGTSEFKCGGTTVSLIEREVVL